MPLTKSTLSSQFISLLETNKGILYKVARSYAREEEEIKDLIQEISIQAWKSFPKYKSEFKFSTWLYRIALNVAISNLRKESKRKEIHQDFDEKIVFKIPLEESASQQSLKILYQVIGTLNSIDRALILLYFEEKSYREISEIIGISETNVATKLNRLKKIIKEEFLKLNQL
ncbi:RNA polymerase sigma factor [Algoriphagus namhaensis]|uniref:RNA polymerase sigma factor n=1 Tax=Algoriphagus namhaensis TaxID=915353 RepID=A0ABV8ANW8_9BACT